MCRENAQDPHIPKRAITGSIGSGEKPDAASDHLKKRSRNRIVPSLPSLSASTIPRNAVASKKLYTLLLVNSSPGFARRSVLCATAAAPSPAGDRSCAICKLSGHCRQLNPLTARDSPNRMKLHEAESRKRARPRTGRAGPREGFDNRAKIPLSCGAPGCIQYATRVRGRLAISFRIVHDRATRAEAAPSNLAIHRR
jgi:hypothetical protein